MTKIDLARKFLSMEIAVIPLRHRGKEPESSMMGGTWERYKTQLPTEYDVIRWLGSGWQNYGVVAGWGNLAVIDFDTTEAWEIWQKYFSMLRGLYGNPYTVKSARGAHVYIRLPGDYANQKRRGVDVKIHGYVVGPESTHPSGAVYTALNTEYQFPEVFDLETFLPSDLFPMVAVDKSEIAMPVMPMLPITSPREDYDPFQAASGASQSVDLLQKVKISVRIENMFPDARFTSADHRWMNCKCPFHADSNPSAWIDTRRQLFGCNSCNMLPMDAINLYARMHNISDSAAVSALAGEVGVWR